MTDKLLDFVEKRKKTIENKKRNFERILFNNLLGVYSVLDQDGVIYPMKMVDISRDGCMIQLPWNGKDEKLKSGTEINMRMYFTKHSYVPVIVNVRYAKEFIDKDGHTYLQYGCEFDKSLPTFGAVESFVEFLYRFAEVSSLDKGDTKVFFF